jgi:hypothetical protein
VTGTATPVPFGRFRPENGAIRKCGLGFEKLAWFNRKRQKALEFRSDLWLVLRETLHVGFFAPGYKIMRFGGFATYACG